MNESYVKFNQANKILQKAIMNRSSLLNRYGLERNKQLDLHVKDREIRETIEKDQKGVLQ